MYRRYGNRNEKIFIKLVDRDYSDKYDFTTDENVVERLVRYILNPCKTEGKYASCLNMYTCRYDLLPQIFARQFYAVQVLSGKFNRDNEDKLIHLMISFPCDYRTFYEDVCMDIAHHIALWFGKGHQLVYALHTNSNKGLHVHFIINPVNFINGAYLKITTTHIQKIYEIIKSVLENNCHVSTPPYDYYINYNYLYNE